MGGRSTKPDATETKPLLDDRSEGNRLGRVLLDLLAAAHRTSSPSTSWANSLSWRLVDSRTLRPLAVAT